jgi:hypothetical protein
VEGGGEGGWTSYSSLTLVESAWVAASASSAHTFSMTRSRDQAGRWRGGELNIIQQVWESAWVVASASSAGTFSVTRSTLPSDQEGRWRREGGGGWTSYSKSHLSEEAWVVVSASSARTFSVTRYTLSRDQEGLGGVGHHTSCLTLVKRPGWW